MRENIIYPLNYQPKFHNILRGTICLGIIIITTSIGKIFVLGEKVVSSRRFPILWTFGLYWVIFDCPMKYFITTHTSFYKKYLGAILFVQNTSKNKNIFCSVEAKISVLTTSYFIGLSPPEKYDFMEYMYVNSSIIRFLVEGTHCFYSI